MFENIGEMLVLFWRTLVALPMAWRQRHKVFEQFFEIGNGSLLMVCVLSFFIGGETALQTGPFLAEKSFGGYLGGIVSAANNRIDIPIQAFFKNLSEVVKFQDVGNGLFKSFCFALIIGIVSCHQGLVTIGGPRGIGRSVTKAVVNSIVLIIVFDYI